MTIAMLLANTLQAATVQAASNPGRQETAR
jgi:5,10-methylene-tetrahydrofolate dehydrogenase/methenyl tetrahydrofolate cyclohydrolase